MQHLKWLSACLLMFHMNQVSGESRPLLPPTLNIISPLARSVANPDIGVKASCSSDSGSCQLNLIIINNSNSIPAGSFTDSCNTTLDLSAYPGSPNLLLEVQAIDSRNQVTVKEIPLYVETSPYLSVVFTADNQIADFLDNRVFVVNDSLPRIVNINNGVVSSIPVGYVPNSDIHLTPQGAVFGVNLPVPAGSKTLLDWNNGSLDSLGIYNGLVTSGNYCIWYAGNLILRNLATQTNQALPNSASNVNNDVTDSGEVVYAKAFNTNIDSIARYQNGNTTIIGDNSSFKSNFAPLTDGKHVVYQQHVPGSNSGPGIYLFDGNTNSLLSDLSSLTGTPAVPQTYYQVNNGYVAYKKLDGNGVLQNWIRDTAGNNTQVTSYSFATTLDLLNPRGDLLLFYPAVYPQPVYRNLYSKSTGMLQISTGLGKSYYQDSTWYISIGRTLFRVNPNISPDKADSFSFAVKPDSVYAFSTGSFSTHFEGSGSLMSVQFIRTPMHGQLKVNGAIVSANQAISRLSLQNLVYMPNTGFIGTDTMTWTGSNGVMSSSDSALLLARVDTLAPPAGPVISGLASAYCSNGGTVIAGIGNFPDTADGTLVTAMLDSVVVGIGSGASCSFALSNLTAGAHVFCVVYSNAAGSSSASQRFNVITAVTPAVRLSSPATSISGASGALLLTAMPVSGSGSSPLYTFALDRNFTNKLLGPGPADSIAIDTAELAIGANMIYVQMRTSDSCYTTSGATDSIGITRLASAVDTTSQRADTASLLAGVSPNPFVDQLTIAGLLTRDAYTISLLNNSGLEIRRTRIAGVGQTLFITGRMPAGIYMVRIYDETTGRVVKMIKVLNFD